MAMKPGRFWLSEPRPYVTHEPMLGRIERASPQFISISDGSWFGTSAVIERMTQMSSMLSATCENNFADLDAALPVFLELERRGKRRAGLAFRGQVLHRQRLAGILVQGRLGIEGIDVRRAAVGKNMNDSLGLARKLRRLGQERRDIAFRARAAPPNRPWKEDSARPIAPMPMPQRHRKSRRVNARCSGLGA